MGACLLTACGSYQFTPTLAVDEEPSRTHSFVYGRFEVDALRGSADEDYETMGLTLQCNDGKLYRLRFDAAQPVLATQVEPSTCWITEVLFAESDGHILARRLFQRGMLDNMHLERGRAYYLGDFFGTVRFLSAPEAGEGVYRKQWSLNGVRDHYQNTTEDLVIAYPKLSRLPTVNQLNLKAKQDSSGWYRAGHMECGGATASSGAVRRRYAACLAAEWHPPATLIRCGCWGKQGSNSL